MLVLSRHCEHSEAMRGNPVNKIQKIWLINWIATLPLAMTVRASFSHIPRDFIYF
jgi:hypothetical protein